MLLKLLKKHSPIRFVQKRRRKKERKKENIRPLIKENIIYAREKREEMNSISNGIQFGNPFSRGWMFLLML